MTPPQRVRATTTRIFGATVGCSDAFCVFGHPGGMATNGGCQCLKNAVAGGRDATRTVHMLAAVARALAAEVTP